MLSRRQPFDDEQFLIQIGHERHEIERGVSLVWHRKGQRLGEVSELDFTLLRHEISHAAVLHLDHRRCRNIKRNPGHIRRVALRLEEKRSHHEMSQRSRMDAIRAHQCERRLFGLLGVIERRHRRMKINKADLPLAGDLLHPFRPECERIVPTHVRRLLHLRRVVVRAGSDQRVAHVGRLQRIEELEVVSAHGFELFAHRRLDLSIRLSALCEATSHVIHPEHDRGSVRFPL